MLSRDTTLSENNKKSLNKNGNTFCRELLLKPDWFRIACNASIYKTVLGLFLNFLLFWKINVGLCRDMQGCVWLCRAMYGYVWLCRAM